MSVPKEGDLLQRPTINSVIARRDRLHRANLIAAGIDPDAVEEEENQVQEAREDEYTETELKMMAEAKIVSLQEHLTELRRRIIISVLFLLLCSSITYYYSEEILRVITAPAGKLYYMKPTEAFFTYMKVSVYTGIILASPVIIYQVWAFIVPALTKNERKASNALVPVAVILFWSGIAFSYFLALPAAVKFFIGFGTDELQPLFSIGKYLDFVVSFVFPFGIVFELPLVVTLLAYFGLISSSFLKVKRKYFFLLAFIIGAILSPSPDVVSQTMIAMPMVILYELSYYIVRYILHK